MIKKIEYFSFILILLLPFSLISGPAIPDISITFVGLFLLIISLYNKNFTEIFNYKWALFSFIFWFFLIFISIFAENKYLSFRDSLIFIRILFIPIFLYLWILKDINKISKLIVVIFTAIIFVCLDTIYQFLKYDPAYGFGSDIFGHVPEFYSRLTGPFRDLVPGAYISKFGLIGIIFIIQFIKNIKFQSLFIIIYLTLVGSVTYISGERMALATFMLGLMILIVFFNKKRLIIFFSMCCILLSIYIINKTHPIYNDYKIIESTPYHLGLTVEKNYICNQNENCKKIIKLQPDFFVVIKNFNKSAYGQIYSLGLKMWKDHPFLGVGLNNFTFLCNNDERYKNKIKNYNCVTHPHNFYLQWLIETGVFGLALFFLYIFFIYYFIINKFQSPYAAISLATLTILFWPIMSTGSLLKNWMGVSTFFIMGICLSLTRFKQKI